VVKMSYNHPHIDNIVKITHLPGRYLIICPNQECYHARDSNDEEREVAKHGKGFHYTVACDACGQPFTLHQGYLQRRLLYQGLPYPTTPGQISVIPWNPFVRVASCTNLEFKVGVLRRLDVVKEIYEGISEVYNIVPYAEGTGVTIEIRRVNQTTFDIVSSSTNEEDVGETARFTFLIFGASAHKDGPVWKELLGGALALIDERAFKSSIIQSHAALEAFVADFMEQRLVGSHSRKWNEKTFKQYVRGDSRDSLPLTGTLQVMIHEVLGIELIDTDMFKNWIGTAGIKGIRDKLAHGNIEKYRQILKKRNITEEEAAHWVLQNIMKMIYHIQYYEPKPTPNNTAY